MAGNSWRSSVESVIYSSDAVSHDYFGWSLALSGKWAIIGSFGGLGSTQLWYKDRYGIWIRHTVLKPFEITQDHLYGYSVAMTENVALVGCPMVMANGYAYIFNRNRFNDKWTQAAVLIAKDSTTNGKSGYNFFGGSVSIHGNIAAISAYKSDMVGAVYIYTLRSYGSWSLSQRLIGRDSTYNDYFGRSVSVHGASVLIGSHCDDDFAYNSGSAYIFTTHDDGLSWTQEAKLVASDPKSADNFGESVSLYGDMALIGAKYSDHDQSAGMEAGAAYVFRRIPSSYDQYGRVTWRQETKLVSDTATPFASFGASVSISENVAVVGALTEYRNITGDKQASGCAFLFERSTSTQKWTMQAKLEPRHGRTGDYFGKSVALDMGTSTVMVGAYGSDKYGPGSGAVYIYEPPLLTSVAVIASVHAMEFLGKVILVCFLATLLLLGLWRSCLCLGQCLCPEKSSGNRRRRSRGDRKGSYTKELKLVSRRAFKALSSDSPPEPVKSEAMRLLCIYFFFILVEFNRALQYP